MNSNILKQLEEFRNTWPVEEAVQYRVTRPSADFIGEEILEMAVMALLDGENLLLVGNKATGKNILAENLAWLFGRPISREYRQRRPHRHGHLREQRGEAPPGAGVPLRPVRRFRHSR